MPAVSGNLELAPPAEIDRHERGDVGHGEPLAGNEATTAELVLEFLEDPAQARAPTIHQGRDLEPIFHGQR